MKKFSEKVEEAYSRLPDQIAEFKEIYPNEDYWQNPKRIISYLTKRRIGHYFDLLEFCQKHRISFEVKKIADAGCYFPYLFYLITQVASDIKLHGYDFNEIALNFGKVLAPKAEYFIMDLFDIKQKYDIVFCTEVLEHLAKPDEALKHLYSILNPSGTLVLTVPIGRKDNHPAGKSIKNGVSYHGHVNLWTKESWTIFCQRYSSKNAQVEVEELDDKTYCAVITRI